MAQKPILHIPERQVREVNVIKIVICPPKQPQNINLFISISFCQEKKKIHIKKNKAGFKTKKNPQHIFEFMEVFYAGDTKYKLYAQLFYNLCTNHSGIFWSANFKCSIISY